MIADWINYGLNYVQHYYAPVFLPILFLVVVGIEVLYFASVILGYYKDTSLRLFLNIAVLAAVYYLCIYFLDNDVHVIICRSVAIAVNVIVFGYLRKIKYRGQ